jgi:hypothetical protein
VLIFTDVLPLSGVGTGAGVALGGLTVLVTTAYSVRELRRAEKADEVERAQQARTAEELEGPRTESRGTGGQSTGEP